MRFLLIILLFLAVLVGPQFWAKRIFAQYRTPSDDFSGTGGELARHLLDRFHLTQVKVETTDRGGISTILFPKLFASLQRITTVNP